MASQRARRFEILMSAPMRHAVEAAARSMSLSAGDLARLAIKQFLDRRELLAARRPVERDVRALVA